MAAVRLSNTIGTAWCCAAILSVALGFFQTPVLAEQNKDADTLYAQAENLYASKNWQLAIHQFDTFRQWYPGDPRTNAAQFYAAEALMQCNRYADAHARYRDLVDGSPLPEQDRRIRFRVGEAAILAGLFEVGGLDLQAFVEEYPNDPLAPEAHLLRGHALRHGEKFDAALAAYLQVIQQYPSSRQMPTALLAAAGLHASLNQHTEAQNRYKQFLAHDPDHPQSEEAIFQLGWSFHQSGDSQQAAEQWKKLHAEFPSSSHWAEATYRLAQATFESGDTSTAETLVQQWLERVHPPTANSGNAFDSGMEEMFARILYLQAQIAASEKRWIQVKAPLEQLLAQFPDSPMRLPAQFWIAEANFRSGQVLKASKQFDQLARLVLGRQENWVPMIPLRQAQILAQQGAWDKAYRLAQSIASDYPTFILQYEVDYVLGWCLANAGEMAQARDAYRRVISSAHGKSTETAAIAQWMIGETYMHQQDFANALAEYLRTMEYSAYPSWCARAALQAGICHERMHQWAAAERWYDVVTKKYEDTDVGSQLALRQDQVRKRIAARTASATRDR